ncbi:MAG: hypothetical protein QOJ60_1861 [Actinomycetota bacterium]|jgi:hypothetical protein|nr:hypothetical protein [Actinomycetota bacterium]
MSDLETTDLRLVAVTPERSHLVLEDDDNRQFRVPIDERLAVALRDRRQGGQLEITLESQLTPRDIQTRIRAGASIVEVAAAAGVPEERIERYAVPVLAEREHVVDQAKLAPARRASNGSAPTLIEVVEKRLAAQEVSDESVRWDGWRSEETRWTVSLTYVAAGHDRTARWTFDPRGRVLAPDDAEAQWLVDETRTARDTPAEAQTRLRRLASVPHPDSDAIDRDAIDRAASDQVYDREADEADKAASGGAPAPRPAARGGRRPAVPSWDDIMFGAKRRD